MPTFTRLAAALIYGVLALYAAERYKLLYDTPPQLGQASLFMAIVGGYVGWAFVGKRIRGAVLHSIFQALQGVIVTILAGLALYGLAEVFRLGYRMRYRNLYEAMRGFFDIVTEHLQRMGDPGFVGMLAAMAIGAGLVLTLIWRWAEARRFK